MIKLYDSKLSGNAWKVRLLLRHLGIPFERQTMNLAEGLQKSPAFTARNRFQRIPVVELEDGRHLTESAAILLYFAESTPLLPQDAVARAEVSAWMFYEQADLLRFLAYPRFFKMTGQSESKADVIAHYREIAEAALTPVERALSDATWLYGTSLTVADFDLYPYIRLAPEGGYELARWPAIAAWLARFEGLPAYEPLVA
jgi:glutathione S-transferase